MKVTVRGGPGAYQVTVPYLKKVLDDAQHCRPQITCPIPGVAPLAYLTTVEADSQPADVGIKLIAIDPATGTKVAEKLIAESDPEGTKFGMGKMYAVQNSGLVHLGGGIAAIGYQVSSHEKKRAGHSGGANVSALATVRLADLAVIERATGVAPYQRHAFSFPTMFGPGAGKPAIAVMGGSSTGTGKGLLRIMELDAAGNLTRASGDNDIDVSFYSDVANLPARGKRNPNNQGAGFLNGVSGADNPGFGKTGGFLPEVRTFFIAALPGYAKDPIQSPQVNRESLWISLVPSTWHEAVKAVPGPVTTNVPPGPSPVVKTVGWRSDAGPVPVVSSTPRPEIPSCGCAVPGAATPSARWIGALAMAVAIMFGVRRKR